MSKLLLKVHEQDKTLVLICEGRITVLHYGDGRQLVTIAVGQPERIGMTFNYRAGLLTKLTMGERTNYFKWDVPVFEEYFRAPRELAPVVVDDGEFEYRTTIDHRYRVTNFRGLQGTISGRWTIDRATHTLKMQIDEREGK